MDEDPFPEDDERLAAEYGAIGHLLSIDRSDLAEARLRRLLRDDPDERHTHYLLGSALRALGRPAEAEAACREAMRLDPEYSHSFALLAALRADAGDAAEAEALYLQALRLDPDEAEHHVDYADLLSYL